MNTLSEYHFRYRISEEDVKDKMDTMPGSNGNYMDLAYKALIEKGIIKLNKLDRDKLNQYKIIQDNFEYNTMNNMKLNCKLKYLSDTLFNDNKVKYQLIFKEQSQTVLIDTLSFPIMTNIDFYLIDLNNKQIIMTLTENYAMLGYNYGLMLYEIK